MKKFVIDDKSNYPIYYQLYHYLLDCIKAGEFFPGECLPSENDMINAYGISRITIRRAIIELENNGFVKRHRGKGTIVLPPKTLHDLNSIYSFSQSARERGDKVSYVILSAEIVEASGKLVEEFDIPFGSNVFELRRLLLINGRIAGYTVANMVYKKELAKIYESINESTSLFDRIHELGMIINYTSEFIEVIKPSNEIKMELHVKENDPVVFSEHRTYGLNEELLVYTKTYFIYSKFKYSTTTKKGKN